MLSYFDLRKGVKFIFEGQPYEVLEFQQIGKAQDVVVAKTKIRNLINGKIIEKNFHQDETFEEAEIEKLEIKFLYSHRGKFVFNQKDDPRKRFEFSASQIGSGGKFLKPNLVLIGLKFREEIINIELPIKVQLKVVEAPPGVQGERSQPGTKKITLETGEKINAPLFIKEGDIIEINTQTGQYVRRVK